MRMVKIRFQTFYTLYIVCFRMTYENNEGELSLESSFETKAFGRVKGGCFLSNQKLLFNMKEEKKLTVCKFDGSEHKSIDLPFEPGCIALYDTRHVIVSKHFGDIIRIVDVEKMELNDKVINLKTNNERIEYVTSLKENIWVCLSDCSIVEMNWEGKKKRTISAKDLYPLELCLSHDGTSFFTSDKNDNIYSITTNDEETVTIEASYTIKHLEEPRGVVADNRGYLYVVGNESRNVIRISRDGKQHNVVLRGINYMTGLSFDSDRRLLLVIIDNGHWVHLYKTQ